MNEVQKGYIDDASLYAKQVTIYNKLIEAKRDAEKNAKSDVKSQRSTVQ
jgi:hypothetical protein